MQTSQREAQYLEPHLRQAMPGHTQTEPVSVHQTRTIIPIMGKFRFIMSCAIRSTEPTTMTVTFNCLRGYPASKSALQMLHRPSQCNITSSALFQMSGLDKNSLCISDNVCVSLCVWSHTYACLRLWSHHYSSNYSLV